MSAAKRREAREARESVGDEPTELAYITRRKGGGVELIEAEVRVVRVVRSKPPEALAIVGARLSGWVAERFSR